MYFNMEGDSNWHREYERNRLELIILPFSWDWGKQVLCRTGVCTFVANLVRLELVLSFLDDLLFILLSMNVSFVQRCCPMFVSYESVVENRRF